MDTQKAANCIEAEHPKLIFLQAVSALWSAAHLAEPWPTRRAVVLSKKLISAVGLPFLLSINSLCSQQLTHSLAPSQPPAALMVFDKGKELGVREDDGKHDGFLSSLLYMRL